MDSEKALEAIAKYLDASQDYDKYCYSRRMEAIEEFEEAMNVKIDKKEDSPDA